MNKFRSHNCNELRKKDVGKKTLLAGWVNKKRDHGNLLFIDLRDHYGITQCVIETKNDFFPILEKSKPESVLKISGKVVKRSGGTENLDLKTGKISVDSPIGKGLLGCEVGDLADVAVPAGVMKFEVIEITRD